MIRFVDIETGNTFDGTYPYVFWIDGEQSINLTYSKAICFISHDKEVQVSIEDNEIFSLVNPDGLINSQLENIYGFEYHRLQDLKTKSLTSIGVNHHNYFVHIIYILAAAQQAGEYLIDVIIDGNPYKVGGDFYEENESLYINLANMGIEIPEVVQKAIYDVDVHEEKRDNVILNRKWKELLSNYWDVIANKGSYKSLYNSLKWFEYGDKLRICELWKEPKDGRYLEKDIQELLTDNFLETLNGYTKTTYIALYHALEQPEEKDGKIVLDDEKNPKLKYVASKWSTQDLALKLCMLGNFYETYFMPIHLDLIHSTIEDVVYSNNFKLISGALSNRNDYVYFTEDISCNVKDNSTYRLGKVECYVGPDTLFGLKYEDYILNHTMMGVQTTPVKELNGDDEWRAFASQMYNDIGAVVDFNINIPLLNGDKIKRSVLVYKTFCKGSGTWKSLSNISYKILDKNIQFSLFCPAEGEYDVRLQFDSMGGKTFTKRVKFNVIDANSISMKVYKIYNHQLLLDKNLGDPCQLNDYIFSRRKILWDESTSTYSYKNPLQYIPAMITSDERKNILGYKGVCLNHLLILHGDITTNELLSNDLFNLLKNYYYIKIKTVRNDDILKHYSILVSKKFGFKPVNNINVNRIYEGSLKGHIYREDYIFVPEFHKLVELDNERMGRSENIKYYTITDADALCIIPDLPYGLNISYCDWEFINVSKPWQDSIKLSYIKEPFITSGKNSPLEPGYYNIKFNYRLTNEDKINSIILDSAFKKV